MVLPQPDERGYVTVTWPSKNVPHGGIMHTRKAEATLERQKFLKVLLEESKLSIAQRQKNGYQLRHSEPKEPKEPSEPKISLIRPRTSKRRSLSAIRAVNALDDYVFKPMKRGEDRERLKDQLARAMAFGTGDETGVVQITPPPAPPPKPEPKLPTAKEQWHELLSQIRERAEWLAEMEVLGHASPHRDVIEAQIAERIRSMKALGVESECSSLRSGFSTTRSREPSVRSSGSHKSKQSSTRSSSSQKNGKQDEDSVRSKLSRALKKKQDLKDALKCVACFDNPHSKKDEDENVAEYEKLTPSSTLTPRRRQ